MSCTTHHHACACREEKFKALETEVERLREALKGMLAVWDRFGPSGRLVTVTGKPSTVDIARAALSGEVAK